MLIIGGTSLTVYPAAGFIRYFGGKHIVVINRDEIRVNFDEEKDIMILTLSVMFFHKLKKHLVYKVN